MPSVSFSVLLISTFQNINILSYSKNSLFNNHFLQLITISFAANAYSTRPAQQYRFNSFYAFDCKYLNTLRPYLHNCRNCALL